MTGHTGYNRRRDGNSRGYADTAAEATAVVVLLAARAFLRRRSGAPPMPPESPIGDGAWSWFGDPRAVTHNGRPTSAGSTTRATSRSAPTTTRAGTRSPRCSPRGSTATTTRTRRSRSGPTGASSSSTRATSGRRCTTGSQPPEDVSSWEAPQTLPTTCPAIRGYTYPNPVRLAERGAPTCSGAGELQPHLLDPGRRLGPWSAGRNLMVKPNERPYAKFAESGGDTIHVAYTNAHPNEFPSVNVHYARIRAGADRAGQGADRHAAGAPSHRGGRPDLRRAGAAWVHDVAADTAGNPVIVFAELPVGGRPPLPLRALDRGRLGGATRSPPRAAPSARTAVRPTTRAGSRSTTRIPRASISPARPARAGRSRPGRPHEDRGGGGGRADETCAVSGGMGPFGGPSVIWMHGSSPNYVVHVAAFTAARTCRRGRRGARAAGLGRSRCASTGRSPATPTARSGPGRGTSGTGRAGPGNPPTPTRERALLPRRSRMTAGRRPSVARRGDHGRPAGCAGPCTAAAQAAPPLTAPSIRRTRPPSGTSSTGRPRGTEPSRPRGSRATMLSTRSRPPSGPRARPALPLPARRQRVRHGEGRDRVMIAGSTAGPDAYRDALLGDTRPCRLPAPR